MAPTTTTKTVKGSPVRGETVTSPRAEVETNAEQPKEAPTKKKWSDITDSIDKATFDQILEMDDDDDQDFSKGIVFGFFDQAESTFEKMEKAQYVFFPPLGAGARARLTRSVGRMRTSKNCHSSATSSRGPRLLWA